MNEIQPTPVQTITNDEVSFSELALWVKKCLEFLLSKWKLIFLVGAIGGSLGYLYAYNQKIKYTATLTIALEDEKAGGGGISGALGLASQLGLDLGGSAGGAFSGSNLVELMKSRKLIEETLLSPVTINNKTLSLAEMYLQFNEMRKDWDENKPTLSKIIQFPPNADRTKFTLQQDSILGQIYNSIKTNNLIVAQKDKKISIINIEVTSKNELFSKLFTEKIAEVVSDFYIDTKSKKAKTNVAILEKQVDSIRRELNNAITGVAVANDITFNLNPALNVNRAPSSKRQVDVQANLAILTELVKNLELAKVSLRKETPLIQIIDKPILPLQKIKMSKLIKI